MKQIIGFLLLIGLFQACRPSNTAVISTEFGDITIRLFDATPQHRDNFRKLAKEHYYDSTLFHRVMSGFMIQGGDPDSKKAVGNQMLGQGGPGYTIPAEPGAPHIKGAVAAARLSDQVNPKRESSGSQFYIVVGQPVNDDMLNAMESKLGIKYSEAQRNLYKQFGGTPFLDGEYTVFGEVIDGLDVVDKIVGQPTGMGDRPIQDIRMKVRMK